MIMFQREVLLLAMKPRKGARIVDTAHKDDTAVNGCSGHYGAEERIGRVAPLLTIAKSIVAQLTNDHS